MKIEDFAEKQTKYTGAISKTKWIIKDTQLLENYFNQCDYKPAILAYNLNTSYSTVKRFLCRSNLWSLAKLSGNSSGGRKRTALQDKFGYKYAETKHDYKNSGGDIIRRHEHHVVAEQKIDRKLKEFEVVHHINLDKSDNSIENLKVCKNNKEHRSLHCQLETVAGKAVKLGIIKFDEEKGYYLNVSN